MPRLVSHPLVLFLLLFPVAVGAAEPPPPQDEWWKKAKPPKQRPPLSWSVGAFAGARDWTGLEDYEPTEVERAAGWRGAFDTTAPDYGIVGFLEAGRFGSIGVGVDLSLDASSFGLTEIAFQPDPNVGGEPTADYDFFVRRLGVAGRSIFRQSSRLQPTASLGVAYAHAAIDSVTYFTTVTQPGERTTTWLDVIGTGGLDVALGKDRRRGWRLRFEAGIEHRGFDDSLGGFGEKTPGPLAYKAAVGVHYRHEPR